MSAEAMFETPSMAKNPRASLLRGVAGVVRYELLRSLTPVRIVLWLGMVLFPLFLILVAAFSVDPQFGRSEQYEVVMSILFFVLLPEIATILGMLLWATPIVNAEIEGHTWIYAVVRPQGRKSMLLGKALMAILWTTTCTCTAVSIAIPFVGFANPLRVWGAMVFLCFLSAIAHGVLFSVIGLLIQRRGMVFAFFYAAVVEGVLGWIPAVINKFTIAYRIRSLMAQWLEIPFNRFSGTTELVSDGVSAWVHIACLLGASAVLMVFAVWRVQSAQYVGKQEG